MIAFCSYTGGESRMSLIYRFVYDVLSNAVPHTQPVLTQLVDVTVIYEFLVDLLLHYSPDLISHGVHIRAVWGPLVKEKWSLGSLGIKVRLCHARALCAGALSCWKMKLSPDISSMHGNSFSFQVQQYFTIIVAVHFHFRLHKKTIPYTRVSTLQQIPLCLCWTPGVLIADVLVHIKFHKVVRQQT